MMIHPKNLQMQNASQMSFLPSSNYDDQFMNQKNYVKIPSPGPPMDGSYYSACDRYLSYPPMVSITLPYSSPHVLNVTFPMKANPFSHLLSFQDHPLDYTVASATLPHNMSTNSSEMNHMNASRSNTLNRRNSNLMAMNHNIIPPPDVTHTTKMMPLMVSSGTGTLYNNKPSNHPPGILKDPKRNQQNNVNKDLQMQSILMPMPSIMMNDGSIPNTHHLSAAQLMNNYDATNANLANFNHQMGFPETDGHLV